MFNDLVHYFLLSVGAWLVLPVLAFLVMKLGTYGFYAGRCRYRAQQRNLRNGREQT